MGREHERVREREEGKRERGAFSRVGLGRLGLGPLRQSLLEDKPSLLPRLQTRQLFMLKLSERSRHDLATEHTYRKSPSWPICSSHCKEFSGMEKEPKWHLFAVKSSRREALQLESVRAPASGPLPQPRRL